MRLFYRIAADGVVAVHFAYVAFVVVGLLAVLIGYVRKWRWVRNLTFRLLHLAAILIVVAETVCGMTCPLTVWEQALRRKAGEATYHGDFIATWLHHTLFFDAPGWVFTLCYSLFGLVVLATFLLVPPKFGRKGPSSNPKLHAGPE